jgi:hypothetical protein
MTGGWSLGWNWRFAAARPAVANKARLTTNIVILWLEARALKVVDSK